MKDRKKLITKTPKDESTKSGGGFSNLLLHKLRTWLSRSKAAMCCDKGLVEMQISFG